MQVKRLKICLKEGNLARINGADLFKYEAEAIKYKNKYFYRAGKIILKIKNWEHARIIRNPRLYYFSTALRLHEDVQRIQKDFNDIVKSHIYLIDKYYRMFAGVSSYLANHINGTIYLIVVNSERRYQSTDELARQIARSWKDNPNNGLETAKGFVAFFYFPTVKREELIGIFSGLLD